MRQNEIHLKNLIELDSQLNRTTDLDILLERILFEARKMVHADAGSIYVIENDLLMVKYAQNDSKQKALPPGQKLIYSIFKLKINTKTISGYVASTGKVINLPNVYRIPANAPYSYNPSYDRISEYKSKSMLTIPLRTNTGKTIGVIQMINAVNKKHKIVPFKKSDEILIMHFADNAAIALERAQMIRTIILRMIRMAELRDPKETGKHVNRVAAYSVELYEAWAHKHNLTEKEIDKNRDMLRMAAMLHDVGKVAISDAILKKPARFSEMEYEIMKAHTYLGARLFTDQQSEFDQISKLIALTHHEKWNGEGYPGRIDLNTGKPKRKTKNRKSKGLKKSEIPLWGRIVAIADVYDALSSKRVYKDEWPEEKVIKELKNLSGKSFDPELINLFLDILPNIKQITKHYTDQE
jgi:HD-GYP domain-containing protein (c-di-GMP phosphodiesterase class II)